MEWLQNLYESFYNALIPEQRYLAYLSGLKMTLLISAFAVLLGIAIGTLVAVIKVSRKNSNNFLLKLGAVLCNIYTTVIRGTPAMLQVLLIYNIVFTSPNTNRVVVGAVCFGINSGAYVAEIIRAGIESIAQRTDGGRPFTGTELCADYARNYSAAGREEYPSGAGQRADCYG